MPGAAMGRMVWPLAVAAALAGCASKQRVPLECVPPGSSVYLDGEKLEEVPSELKLKADRPHTVYIKGPGIVPELVVLTTEEVDGKLRLSPESVCAPPRAVEPVGRRLKVEIDPAAPSDTPANDDDLGSTVDVEPRPDFSPGER